ncbi:MAG: bifunctional demethylmenaquinone methyltransferase/2-methoxy-6-polyprenyl-1,4-benzoquinol methylase UbiE [Pseudomonadota bacterium]
MSDPAANGSSPRQPSAAAPSDAQDPAAQDRTHFGFREVTTAEKPSLVRGVFDSVASRYDLMNDLMSAGVHRLWKAAMIDWLSPRSGGALLDLAGGTGDIAILAQDRVGGGLETTIADLTEAMLQEGRKRFEADGRAPAAWVCADATRLPFQDKSFDYVTMAFGIRNVAEPDKALSEIRRVLRPGGRFMCLEFSHVVEPGLARLYDAYSFNVIPAMGRIVTGDGDSYQYLVESIRRFPNQERFAGMIREAGFGQVSYRNLTRGVAALHSGWRI